ncbi:MAG: copper-containing nitrite reductase [Chloroflexota bacterium]
MSRFTRPWIALLAMALLLAACSGSPASTAAPSISAPTSAPVSEPAADVEYTLRTGGPNGELVFVGVGGDIEGVTNPTLTADPGQTVKITLVNGDGVTHDLTIDEFTVQTAQVDQAGDVASVTFTVQQDGEFIYYCSLPGHRQAGMWGTLRVGEPASQEATATSVIRDPSDVPPPVGDRPATTVRVDLEAIEVEGQLADGTTFGYFTFNGPVPGPMIRIRVGDTVELHLANNLSSSFQHSIDLHAVTGPGGGAVFTQTPPGQETSFTFQALNPGLYVYHCATPSVAHHIANGMYGLILVEPEGGLPPVDREFYVMQGEVYTEQPFGTQGHLDFSMQKLLDESPEYFIFNGAAGALTKDAHALRANVGETVRIFFGVGGPNFTSSFHVIGEIFDRVYPFAALTSPPLTDVQTVSVPPGGATMLEFRLDVPGRYILVDHALSRLERGLAGYLYAEGEDHPEIFSGTPTSGSGH